MMEVAREILTWALILGGAAFTLIGSLGVIRLPDFYSRLHAAGIVDTLGAGLLLLSMIVHAGFTLVSVKLLLIGLFLFFTSPTATHAIANAAYVAGLRPEGTSDEDGAGKSHQEQGESNPSAS